MHDDIGHLIKIVNERLKSRMDENLKQSGLTIVQAQTMHFIHIHNGSVTQKEIEEYLQVSHPTVVGILSRLERKGFLTIEVNPADRRGRIVRTTGLSDQFRAESIRGKQRTEQLLVRGLSEQDIATLKRCLQTMLNNLSQSGEESCGVEMCDCEDCGLPRQGEL